MPVQGICHAFQFVQSLCFFALAKFANCGLCRENLQIWNIEKAM